MENRETVFQPLPQLSTQPFEPYHNGSRDAWGIVDTKYIVFDLKWTRASSSIDTCVPQNQDSVGRISVIFLGAKE